jgi:hypothetical protein
MNKFKAVAVAAGWHQRVCCQRHRGWGSFQHDIPRHLALLVCDAGLCNSVGTIPGNRVDFTQYDVRLTATLRPHQ